MSAGFNILCYKSKQLADGSHPLMIRVSKDGKKKYISLGVSVKPQFWDFGKNQPKRNCPNKNHIEKLIARKREELSELILELEAENKQYTATSLIEKSFKGGKNKTVGELFTSHIANLKSQKRRGYAQTFMELYNSLVLFNGHLDFYFSDIDIVWLKRYETWQQGQGLLENTIGKRMRTLRVLYNIAIEENHVTCTASRDGYQSGPTRRSPTL